MLKKPDKCCEIGTYGCDVPMPIARRVCWIDFCIADIVAALNAANIPTIASCCGHAKMDGNILLEDGREIVVRLFKSEWINEDHSFFGECEDYLDKNANTD